MPGGISYETKAEPRTYASKVPVFCAYDKIVRVEELNPNPLNPNQHDEAQVKLLSEVITSTGWRVPITVSKRSNMIVRGHGRLEAAKLAGLREVPVDFQEYANDAEEFSDLLADNRLAELACIDNVMLCDVFEHIDSGEVPFELTGYTQADYMNIAAALDESEHEGVVTVKRCPNCGYEL